MRLVRGLIERQYVQSRGIESGIDARLKDRDLFIFFGGKALGKLRATMSGHPQAFIAPTARLSHRGSLSIGKDVSIGRGVLIDAMSSGGVVLEDAATVDIGAIIRGSGGVRRLGAGVTIKRRAAVGAYNFIHGGGGVTIGEDVLLSPHVQIFSENHNFSDPRLPIIEQGETPAPVTIGRGSWLGAGTVVLAGTSIGEGVVVAAGSVVTSDLPDRCVAAGAPAKVIKYRSGRDPRQRLLE
jgi:acetyltransferase-like isoleucine patch superfamily enzyme